MLGCTDASRELINRKVPSQNKVIEINDTDKQFYTREEESEELKDPYGLVHLKKHEVYKVKEDIFIDLYFNDEVKRAEIDNARAWVMKLFVLKNTSKFGMPYEQLLLDKLKWNKATSRIFIDETKIFEEEYVGSLVRYEENTEIVLPLRIMASDAKEAFEKALKQKVSNIKSTVIEKSLKGNVTIVKIGSTVKYDEKDILNMKGLIESDLASNMENEAVGLDAIGIVLQVYNKEGRYFEETYFSGKDKYWFAEDWMNYSYH